MRQGKELIEGSNARTHQRAPSLQWKRPPHCRRSANSLLSLSKPPQGYRGRCVMHMVSEGVEI